MLYTPDAKEEESRHIEGAKKKQDKHPDFAGWKHHQIGTQDRRDSTTRASGRDSTFRIQEDVCGRSGQCTTEIKKDKGNLPDDRFNIVSKYPEEKHVADQMHPSSMQKHVGQEGEVVLAMNDFYWDDSIFHHKTLLKPRWYGHLYKKDQDVDANQQIAKERLMSALYLLVLDWKNHP